MKVKDILEKKGTVVWTIQENQSIHEALGMLVEHRIGALMVLNQKKEIAGIISERDMIRECYRAASDLKKVKVSESMTRKLIVGEMTDDLDYVMGIMTQNRIRHFPIMHEGKLQGMISIGDIVKAQLQDREYENRYLKDYMFGTGPGGR